MSDLKMEFMPEATRRNFERIKDDPRLSGLTLIGGTALALQIGHRISEDLDFNIFGEKLPVRSIDAVLEDLAAAGSTIQSLIPPEKKIKFKINTSENLDYYIQDYLIDGSKVTFHSRNNRPKNQIEFLKSTKKIKASNSGFDILGIDGLFAMKSIVAYDRVKSRDIYDLMILTRDHGYTIEDVLEAIDSYQPARSKDPEHFKSVATGIIPLNEDDEGFENIHLDVRMSDIYKYFSNLINEYEIRLVKQMAPRA